MPGISIAATNPCHLFHLAKALHGLNALGTYYSGYPTWKLPGSSGLPVTSFPTRTLAVYGLLRYVSPRWRPQDHRLFQWQDEHFDRLVAGHLREEIAIHAMPGQCLEVFRAARKAGIQTVLNHATGPSEAIAEALHEEYARVGLPFHSHTRYDAAYCEREAEERQLADIHCVASSVVARQLNSCGIANERIWQIPYAADSSVFHPPISHEEQDGTFRIVFAGQLTLRKGVRFLLEALTLAEQPSWKLDFYGTPSCETAVDLEAYRGASSISCHGALSQQALAEAFRQADILVLPSLEEGFGLVVVQALNCGLPCIVSDVTGAKDLISHRRNGSIIPASNAECLAAEIQWWSAHRRRVEERHDWETAAKTLIDYHTSTPLLHLAECA